MIATEPASQRVIVGRNNELLRARLVANDVNWISIPPIASPVRAQVKIRNKHAAALATLYPTDAPTRVAVHFDDIAVPGGDPVALVGWKPLE